MKGVSTVVAASVKSSTVEPFWNFAENLTLPPSVQVSPLKVKLVTTQSLNDKSAFVSKAD